MVRRARPISKPNKCLLRGTIVQFFPSRSSSFTIKSHFVIIVAAQNVGDFMMHVLARNMVNAACVRLTRRVHGCHNTRSVRRNPGEWRETVGTENDRWRVHQRWCDPTSHVSAVDGLCATSLSHTVATPSRGHLSTALHSNSLPPT